MDLPELDRRELLRHAGIGGGALILGGVPVDTAVAKTRRKRRNRTPFARKGSFPQGISTTIPSERGAVLWTRLGGVPQGGNRRLTVEVARDRGFRKVVHRRTVTASAKRDHTVEVALGGKYLKPGQEYFYRFETKTVSSEVGSFRTRPPLSSQAPVRFGVFSCQDWQSGYFNAHSALAAEDLDFVVCLGDYIYERNFYEGPRHDRLGANKDGEVQTLGEYRSKYRQYKGDADLRALHAAHPYAIIWDDHEVEDNYAGDRPGDATQNVRVPFAERRRAGYRSFYEYHPVAPVVGRPEIGRDLYRKLRYGANVELFLLDERQYRDDQPCGDSLTSLCLEAENDPRTYLGREQLEWLKRGVLGSSAAWKIIGNQLMVMSIDTVPGLPVNKDSWDGYGRERNELLAYLSQRGVRDLTFMTGDIHTFFAGNVGINGRGPGSVATEFVCGSVSSLGVTESIGDLTGLPPDASKTLVDAIALLNPHITYKELESRGYAVVEAAQAELNVTYKAVDALRRGATKPRTLATFRVPRGVSTVQRTG